MSCPGACQAPGTTVSKDRHHGRDPETPGEVAPAVFPYSRMERGISARHLRVGPRGRRDRHDHADPAVARLCAARGVARRDGALCLDPAARGLCDLWHLPRARGRSRGGRVPHDRGRRGQHRRAGDGGIRAGRDHARVPVGAHPARHGRLSSGFPREFPVASGHRRVHHRLWPADRDIAAQTRAGCSGPWRGAV